MRIFSLTFLCFIIFSVVSYAEEDEKFSLNDSLSSVVALEGLPSSIVEGRVCAISGLSLDRSVDFSLIGPETLTLQRTYSSAPARGNIGFGWNVNHGDWVELRSTVHDDEEIWGCFITEPSGARDFHKRRFNEDDEKKAKVSFKMVEPKGLTNGSSGEISGRTNKKNHRVEWLAREKKIVCEDGAKANRIFYNDGRPSFFVINSDRKANGSVYRYKHHKDNFLHISAIDCFNFLTKKHYAHVDIKLKLTPIDEKYMQIQLETSDQRQIKYEMLKYWYKERFTQIDHNLNNKIERECTVSYLQHYLSEVSNPSKPTEKYSYVKRSKGNGLLLHKKTWPNNLILTHKS